MDKYIRTGMGLVIVLVVLATIGYLALKFMTEPSFFASQTEMVPATRPVMSIKTSSETKAPEENRVVPTTEFSRSKYRLSFKYPATFYRQKEVDGTSVYVTNFASKDTQGNTAQLGENDVQLSVVVKKGKTVEQDDMKKLEQLGVVKIEKAENPTIDGVTASQYLLRVLREDPGCDLRTDFRKGDVSYRVSLFSIGGSCEVVRNFLPEYQTLLGSFHVGE